MWWFVPPFRSCMKPPWQSGLWQTCFTSHFMNLHIFHMSQHSQLSVKCKAESFSYRFSIAFTFLSHRCYYNSYYNSYYHSYYHSYYQVTCRSLLNSEHKYSTLWTTLDVWEKCICTSYIFKLYLFVLLYLFRQNGSKPCRLRDDAWKVAGGRRLAPAQPRDRRAST